MAAKKETYLQAAVEAQQFIEGHLCGNDVLYTSYRKERRSEAGFLDDYANEIFALLALYEATLKQEYLEKARRFCGKVIQDFYDEEHGGFFLYGKENEQLILRPKETYDGAVFSGNSAMAYNLVRLYLITGEEYFAELAERQLGFMSVAAEHYPAGYAMFLMALLDYMEAPEKVTVVVKERQDLKGLAARIPLGAIVTVLDGRTPEYPMKNEKTTYYICRGHMCLPPVNKY